MSHERVIGQERVRELMKRAVEAGQVAHAYLFYGPEGVGKDALAIEFARVLNCEKGGATACGVCASCRKIDALQHPNLVFVCALPVGKNEKTGDDPIQVLSEEQVAAVKEQLALKAADPYHRISIPKATFIKVNSVRQIRREASLSRARQGRRVFLVSMAESMNLEASNSLLKTLEEPPSSTILILTSSRKEQLLPTIVSRCQVIRFDALSEEDIARALRERDGVEPVEAEAAASLANGSYTSARDLASANMVRVRGDVVHFLRTALGNSKIALLHEVERLSSSDRSTGERWLRALQTWLHDAMELREGREEKINHALTDDIRKFNERFPNADLVSSLQAIERCIALLDKNVYLPLIFTNLANDLRSFCHRGVRESVGDDIGI